MQSSLVFIDGPYSQRSVTFSRVCHISLKDLMFYNIDYFFVDFGVQR